MTRRALAVVLVLLLAPCAAAEAGHEIPYYPSFYPQQITLHVAAPAEAARRLARHALHAYVGPDPFADGAAPAHVRTVESLAGYLVLTFTAAGPRDPTARCAAAAALGRALPAAAWWVAHPYPVTPYHGDAYAHADLIAARRAAAEAPGPAPPLRVRATGRAAALLAGAGWRAAGPEAEAVLEEIPLERLLADARTDFVGHPGPPWLKAGWWHAYLVLAGSVRDAGLRQEVEALARTRREAPPAAAGARLTLERRLVERLVADCGRVVLGYTVRREAIDDDYAAGIENVAWDAHAGLGAAIFPRTAKLKDFPWNGWLELGVPARPAAAWNPIAGFTDVPGRLLWALLADPALLPTPRDEGWLDNRVRVVEARLAAAGAPVEVPAGALVPDPRAGLRPAERPTPARARVVYEVLASKFHDGTAMTPADLLYPFALAARWGSGAPDAPGYDPEVARATALLRSAFAGARVRQVTTAVKEFGDVQILNDVPVVEVYLAASAAPHELAALAPPWSPVPWTVLALAEQAVARGLAAFSAPEARRRGRPWLDLVRDPALARRLDALAAQLERQAYVPEALRGLVDAAEARRRWGALRRHYRQAGHFLVTNGPYRLARRTPEQLVLEAFRDLSYPLVVGTFDRYAYPRRAWVMTATQEGARLAVRAEAEVVVRQARTVALERIPLRVAGGRPSAPVVARWALLDAAGAVVAAGTADRLEGDRLLVEPGAPVPPGQYRLLLALAVDGNAVAPAAEVLPYRVAD